MTPHAAFQAQRFDEILHETNKLFLGRLRLPYLSPDFPEMNRGSLLGELSGAPNGRATKRLNCGLRPFQKRLTTLHCDLIALVPAQVRNASFQLERGKFFVELPVSSRLGFDHSPAIAVERSNQFLRSLQRPSDVVKCLSLAAFRGPSPVMVLKFNSPGYVSQSTPQLGFLLFVEDPQMPFNDIVEKFVGV